MLAKPKDKAQFIRDLCNNVRDRLLVTVPKMPVDWDGHELRVLIAEAFNDSASMSTVKTAPRGKRARDFRNALLTLPRLY